MIGNFARLLRGPHRALQDHDLADPRGEPPAPFVAKVSDEGGDVYVAPVLETLRAALRRHLQPSTDAPQDATEATPAEGSP